MLCNVILLKKYYRQVIDIVYPTQKKSKKDTEVYSVHLTYINVHISHLFVPLDCILQHMIKKGEKTLQMKFYYLINMKNYSKSHVLKKFSFQPLVFVCIIDITYDMPARNTTAGKYVFTAYVGYIHSLCEWRENLHDDRTLA